MNMRMPVTSRAAKRALLKLRGLLHLRGLPTLHGPLMLCGGRRGKVHSARHTTGEDRYWTAATITATTTPRGAPSDPRCPRLIAPTIAAGIATISAAAFGMRRADPDLWWWGR